MPARFSSSDLKWIAMGTMFVDHAALAVLYWNGYTADPYWNGIYTAMRLIGRMAFPLFAFLLVQGYLHTRNWKRYAGRLFLAALISEIPYNLVAGHTLIYPEGQNTLVLLLIGLLTMKGLSKAEVRFEAERIQRNNHGRWSRWNRNERKVRIWIFLIIAAGLAAAYFTRADYGPMGLLFILALYFFRDRPQERMIAGAVVFLALYGDLYGLAAWIAFFFMNRYNGEKGWAMGMIPYLFYPAHLLILYGAGVFIHGLHF